MKKQTTAPCANCESIQSPYAIQYKGDGVYLCPACITTSDEAREYSIEWQQWVSTQALSYGEIAEWQGIFSELADRYPELREEFTENGII